MMCGGGTAHRTLRGHCACSVCLSADSSLRTFPPTPHPPSGPVWHDVGPDGGPSELRSDRRAVRDRRAVGGHVLSGGVGSLAAPLFGTTGTNQHSPHAATPPKSLIFHAPRVIRTPDLLIRSRPVGEDVRDFSRTYAPRCSGRAHEKSRISPPKDTEKTQPDFPRKFCLARTVSCAWDGASGDASRPGPSPPPRMGTDLRVE
jgi:hypothetical protein